jgi:LEA14-like dessication related protein
MTMGNGSRSVLKAALAVVVLLAVVAVVGVVVYERPSVVAVDTRFGAVNESATAIETDVVVHNPYPLGITLGDATVNYTVQLNSITVARGMEEGIPLTTGNTTIEETTLFDNGDVPEWWVSHVSNGERTRAEVTARVDTSLFGWEFTRTRQRTITTDLTDRINTTETRPVDPTDTTIPLVADPPLYVNETSARWGPVTENRTALNISTTLYNPSTVPYPVSRLEYTISMNNVTVGRGTTRRSYLVPSGAERTVNATLAIDNSALDEWWVSHIGNNQTTDVRIEVAAVIDLPSGDTLTLPLEPVSRTRTFKTDLLGGTNESATQ